MARSKLSSATELCNVSGVGQRSRCPQATLLGSLIYLFYVNLLMYTLPQSASLKIFANYVKFIYLSVVTYKRNLKVKFARLLQIRKISPFERGSAEQQLKLLQTLCFTWYNIQFYWFFGKISWFVNQTAVMICAASVSRPNKKNTKGAYDCKYNRNLIEITAILKRFKITDEIIFIKLEKTAVYGRRFVQYYSDQGRSLKKTSQQNLWLEKRSVYSENEWPHIRLRSLKPIL